MLNFRTLFGEPVVASSGGRSVKSLQGSGILMKKEENKLFAKSTTTTLTKIGGKSAKIEVTDGIVSPVTECEEMSLKNVIVSGATKNSTNRNDHDDEEKELRIISLDEIAWHDTPDDCWFAIYDYVYDCTSFLRDHPGGDDVLLEYAGRDATLAFIGAGHSKFAQKSLERYLIGELPSNERIFRIDGGVKVYGL